MNREDEVKDPRLFDVRTVERNIKRGLVTRKEYEKFLKSLPDAAEKVTPSESEPHAEPASVPQPEAPQS
jgi:hypothetical protein